MKKGLTITGISLAFMLSFSTFALAENYDFANMTLAELEEVKNAIDEEINQNHKASSSETSAVEKAIKAYVEDFYGSDNVDWAWFDYSYTKDWNFYSLKTHADIKKQDGGKAQYDVYSELFATGDNYQIVYVKIGEEEIFNERSQIITDQRVLKQLGIGGGSVEFKQAEETPTEGEESTEQAATSETSAAEEVVIAKRGDRTDEALAVQQMLVKLGFLASTPDGAFGEKTEAAVMEFQTANGFTADGIVTQSVYDSLMKAADAAPEPEQVISISAVDLYNTFDNNAIAAKSEYKGKTIQVTGTVGSIDESIWGTPFVRLNADEWGITSVTCYFSSDDVDVLSGLSTGQTVTIKGTCGEMGFADVDMKDCKVVG